MHTPSDPKSQDATELSSEPFMLSDALKKEIDHWLSKYPSNQRQSAIIPALLTAQREHNGWLSRAVVDAVADYIGMPRAAAYEVATFYSMLELEPVGEYKLSICTNVSCMLNGCDKIVAHVQQRLKVKFGETTADKRFTLKEVECLGACTRAPVMLVNDTYHESITLEAVNTILDDIEKGKYPTDQS